MIFYSNLDTSMEKDRMFDDMSKNFQIAFGLSNNSNYKQSIPFYEKAIREDKNNFSALNNLAVAKIYVGINKRDKSIIEEAIIDFKEAIRITIEIFEYKDGFPIAQDNLKWAENELLKLSI